eukprot:gene10904-biopygen7474
MCRVDSAVRRCVPCGQRRVAPCGAVRTPCGPCTVRAPPCGAVRRHVSPCGAVCAVRAVWQRGVPCGKGAPCGVPCGMPCGVFISTAIGWVVVCDGAETMKDPHS